MKTPPPALDGSDLKPSRSLSFSSKQSQSLISEDELPKKTPAKKKESSSTIRRGKTVAFDADSEQRRRKTVKQNSSRRLSKTSSFLDNVGLRGHSFKNLIKPKPPQTNSRQRTSFLMSPELSLASGLEEVQNAFTENHKLRRDSELESQMDNFVLPDDSERSSSSDDNSFYSMSDSIDNSPSKTSRADSMSMTSDMTIEDHSNPEFQVVKRMKEFYDSNYNLYTFNKQKDFLHSRIWKVAVDEVYDIAYVFRAKITFLRRERCFIFQGDDFTNDSKVVHFKSDMASKRAGGDAKSMIALANNLNHKQATTRDDSEDELDERVLQNYRHNEIELEVKLEIWNLDDRVFQNADHQQTPMSTHKVFEKTLHLPQKLSISQVMDDCQRLHQDCAQILQNKNKVTVFSGADTLFTYDSEQRTVWSVNVPEASERWMHEPQAQQSLLFYKDLGKKSQSVESIIQFTYSQFSEEERRMKPMAQTSALNLIAQIMKKKKKQKLGVRIFEYSTEVNQEFELLSEATISIDDDFLAEYYEGLCTRRTQSFFVQRIRDSNSFIMLFPTGLLLQVSAQPFGIQSKLQLNFRKEETITDMAYCVEQDQKNHCFWLIDEKQQVWRCVNEFNPNKFSWTLSKIAMHDPTKQASFLKPAMTFNQHYLTTDMLSIGCLKLRSRQFQAKQQEFLFSFNGSATKVLIVQQPRLETQTVIQKPGPRQELTIEKMLEKQYNLDSSRLGELRLSMLAMCKTNLLIMNKVPQRKLNHNEFKKMMQDKNTKETLKMLLMRGDSTSEIGDGQDPSDNLEIDMDLDNHAQNDIIEFLYSGKVDRKELASKEEQSDRSEVSHSRKFVRQFVIRRKRKLDLMYTNGLYHWIESFPEADARPPLTITRVHQAMNRSKLIVFYAPKSDPTQTSIRVFNRSLFGKFTLLKEKPESKDNSSMFFNVLHNLCDIRFDLIKINKASIKTRDLVCVEGSGNHWVIMAPDSALPPELGARNFSSLQVGFDLRVLTMERIVIRLSDKLDEVLDIGCFIYKRMPKQSTYKFVSLLDRASQKEILDTFKKNQRSVLKLDDIQPPVFPKYDGIDHFYVLQSLDEATEETVVLKIYMSDFSCHEVYRSKGRVTNLDTFMRKKQATKSPMTIRRTKENPNAAEISIGQIGLPSSMSYKLPPPDTEDIFLALVSRKGRHLELEVICDPIPADKEGLLVRRPTTMGEPRGSNRISSPEISESETTRLFRKTSSVALFQKLGLASQKEESKTLKVEEKKCSVQYLIRVNQRQDLNSVSQLTWVTKSKLMVTINSEFYLFNLKHHNLSHAKSSFNFGTQQVNMGLFCSLLKVKKPHDGIPEETSTATLQKLNKQLTTAQASIDRMEVASIRRFVSLKGGKRHIDKQRMSLFFSPAEELCGGNIFSRVSNHFKIIQPYLEQIDSDFIEFMNSQILNIQAYVDSGLFIVNGLKQQMEQAEAVGQEGRPLKFGEQEENMVHMYQADIYGMNAIDYAFSKNAIFCIKAFVESLMLLPDEVQFRNCFDKALLMMINHNINVNQLLNSELFYPTIWGDRTLFSAIKETQIIPYNGDLIDLEFEIPSALFPGDGKGKDEKEEQVEMQYNYIFMEKIESEEKIELSRTLKDCEEFDLFEQEVIKNIIDYKWDAYGRDYFFQKFLIYAVFLVLYYLDMETVNALDVGETRHKGAFFYTAKIVCSLIQLFFFSYEIKQIQIEGSDYFEDPWNYMELAGNFLFAAGAYLDIVVDEVHESIKAVFAFSIIFTLIKVVYLIRVFQQLNFLVTMFITVVKEIQAFMTLFLIFVMTFAEAFHLIGVDISAYGRTPHLLAHVISVLRCAMGDFSLIDPYQGFDLKHSVYDSDLNEEIEKPVHSRIVMLLTWLIFVICVFFLFMIFMNFIIAVIGESYSKVIERKEAFDYQQRAAMIYEREVLFSDSEFEDGTLFPRIIIVKKPKETKTIQKSQFQGFIDTMKAQLKQHTSSLAESISTKTIEQKQHFMGMFKVIEAELMSIASDLGSRVRSEEDESSDSRSVFTARIGSNESRSGRKSSKGMKLRTGKAKRMTAVTTSDHRNRIIKEESDESKETVSTHQPRISMESGTLSMTGVKAVFETKLEELQKDNREIKEMVTRVVDNQIPSPASSMPGADRILEALSRIEAKVDHQSEMIQENTREIEGVKKRIDEINARAMPGMSQISDPVEAQERGHLSRVRIIKGRKKNFGKKKRSRGPYLDDIPKSLSETDTFPVEPMRTEGGGDHPSLSGMKDIRGVAFKEEAQVSERRKLKTSEHSPRKKLLYKNATAAPNMVPLMPVPFEEPQNLSHHQMPPLQNQPQLPFFPGHFHLHPVHHLPVLPPKETPPSSLRGHRRIVHSTSPLRANEQAPRLYKEAAARKQK